MSLLDGPDGIDERAWERAMNADPRPKRARTKRAAKKPAAPPPATIPADRVHAALRSEMSRLFAYLGGVWTHNDWDRGYWTALVASAAFSLRLVVGDIAYGTPLYSEALQFVKWADAATTSQLEGK